LSRCTTARIEEDKNASYHDMRQTLPKRLRKFSRFRLAAKPLRHAGDWPHKNSRFAEMGAPAGFWDNTALS
jgi:hypothetical protein